MAKIVLDIPAAAMIVVVDALSLWAGTQGNVSGTKTERALWALRRFVGQTVRQYRAEQARAQYEADYQAAQESATRESDSIEKSITSA